MSRAEVRVVLRCALEDLGSLADHPAVTCQPDLVAPLRETGPSDNGFVWFAASAREARDARALLLDRGLPTTGFSAAAYWSGAD